MESKSLVPIAGAIIVVVLAVVLYLSFAPKPVTAPQAEETATSSSAVPEDSGAASPGDVQATQPSGASVANTSSAPLITSSTLWKSTTLEGWGLTFSEQTSWQVSVSNDANGKPSFVSIGGPTSAAVISKDLHIATPSDNTPSVTTQTIAGQSVSVSKYFNPQPGYVYSLSFMLPIQGSTYYVLYQSATSSTKVADDFISLLKVTQ